MKVTCEVVKDLLPLYHDNVCSDNSRTIVEEHLTECDTCREEMQKINNTMLDYTIQLERDNILMRHTKKVHRTSYLIGISTALIMAVPILICLIVNLAVGHALDWFFIVLASMITLASITVVPLIALEHKLLYSILSFTGSIALLLFTVCSYTGGDWFFISFIPTFFGLFLIFAPYIMQQLPLRGFASQHKGFIVMTLDTILLYVVVIVSLYYVSITHYLFIALFITTISMSLPWIIFIIIRYMKMNGYTKAGVCTIISAVYIPFLSNIINRITDSSNYGMMHINTLIYFILSIIGMIAGISLLMIGFLHSKKH